jgi:hypothetical protein
MPKTGTMSLTQSLTNAGYKTAHWTNDKGEYIGELILKAKAERLPMLHFVNEFEAYTQMDLVLPGDGLVVFPQFSFRMLEKQYPKSLFILNLRDLDKQVRSIQNWGDLYQRMQDIGISDIRSFLYNHNKYVINHFKGKRNFITFDIENDSEEKLSSFLGREIKLVHINRTTL